MKPFGKIAILFFTLSLAMVVFACKGKHALDVDFSNEISGTEVSFYNNSKNADIYSWDFGDGTTSTEENPTHTYAKNAFYTVTLEARNALAMDKCEKVIDMSTAIKPIADFSVSTNASFTARFTNLSKNAESYYWDFGDGKIYTNTNQSYTYNTIGTKTVSLVAVNGMAMNIKTVSFDMTGYIKMINNSRYPFSIYIDNALKGTLTGGYYSIYHVTPGGHKVRVLQNSGYYFYPTDKTYNFTCNAGVMYSQSFTD